MTALAKLLVEQPELVSAALDAIDALVVVLDRHGCPILFNAACRRLTGHTLADLRQRPFWETLLPHGEAIDGNAAFLRLRSDGRPLTVESHLVAHDERRFRVAWTLCPLADAEGVVQHVLATGRDVTEERRVVRALEDRNAELERQAAELEQLFRSKDEFLAMVSHELRTPLVTGLGYLDLLLGGHLGEVEPTIRERMRVAHRNLVRLSSLVDDILAYQRATQRRLGGTLQLESVDLRELCTECVGEFLIRHEEHVDRVRLMTPAGLVLVRADPDSLRRVLANLMENAARHAGVDADITVSVGYAPRRRVAISVCDNGIGMDEPTVERVFEPFVQAGKDRSGSGLGLAIVRGILEAHGTEPVLQSIPGDGTKVSFLLRMSDAAAALPRTFTPVAVPLIRMHDQARILLVDDDRDTLEFLQLALESAGYEVSTALSAEDALDLLTRSTPDLFILDLSLPGQDGVRLCRRLKTDVTTAGKPVYMFTGRADEPSRRRAEAAGADGYIVKPVDARTLLRTVQTALGELDGAGRP